MNILKNIICKKPLCFILLPIVLLTIYLIYNSTFALDDKEIQNREHGVCILPTPSPKHPLKKNQKIAYLTFDDGPSTTITPYILDILKKNNIKATFFVVGKMAKHSPALIRREFNEGHTIANHTYTHNYRYVYSSTKAMTKEIKQTEAVLTSIIGKKNITHIYRFPGGAHKKNFMKSVAALGYYSEYWNCLTGDTEARLYPTNRLISNFKKTFKNRKEEVILIHDLYGKTTNIPSLQPIINFLKSKGYAFDTIDHISGYKKFQKQLEIEKRQKNIKCIK